MRDKDIVQGESKRERERQRETERVIDKYRERGMREKREREEEITRE